MSASRHSPASLKKTRLPRSAKVLLLVDFINPLDFPEADRMVPDAFQAAQAAARLKDRLARRGVPAIYANDNYGTWHSDFRDLLQACQALPGHRGEIARLLAPAESDLTVLKPRHSAFQSTPLDLLLRQMEADKLIIVGLATDMCVHLSAMDAYMNGYKVWVPADCTAAQEQGHKDTALAQMARVFKCDIRPGTRPRGGA